MDKCGRGREVWRFGRRWLPLVEKELAKSQQAAKRSSEMCFFFFCGEAMEKEVQERTSGLGKLSFLEEA